jgi:hypothetical protein
MQIIETKFNYLSPLIPLDLNKVNTIVYHHTASTTATAEQIHKWHLEKGFNGFGYNEYIRKDGSVFIGRGFNIGAHTHKNNSKTYAICFEGNFEEEDLTPFQITSGRHRTRYLMNEIFKKQMVLREHKDYGGTLCAGKNFQLSLFTDIEYYVEKLTNFTAMDLNEAIEILYLHGIITSKDYHRQSFKFYTNQERLFINMASFIKNNI